MCAMRDFIDRLLSQASLVTLALAIALGWSLFQWPRESQTS